MVSLRSRLTRNSPVVPPSKSRRNFDIEATSTTIEDASNAEADAYVGENVAILGATAGDSVEIETPDGTLTRGLGGHSGVRTLDTSNYEAGDQISVAFDTKPAAQLT